MESREQMVNQANALTAFDKETGGVVMGAQGGGDKVIPAVDGKSANLLIDNSAHVKSFNSAKPNGMVGTTGDLVTTYHSHPMMSIKGFDPGGNTISWSQEPSTGDKSFASANKTSSGYHIMLSPSNNTVHFFNASGTIATVKMRKFSTLK